MCSLKCKAESMALTPAKVLKASTALKMRTPADDAAWLARYRATTERLKSTGSSVQAGGSVGEAVGAWEAARWPKLVEATLGASGLGQSRGDSHEAGPATRISEAVEAREVATSARDTGQVDVVEIRNMEETPQDMGQEEEL
jgi:hypothetical protein